MQQPKNSSQDATPTTFFVLGIGAGASVALFVFAATLCANKGDCGVYNFLNDWQTLISAAVALVAAVPTVFILNRQIRQEQNRAAEALERDQYAAKTALPAGLVELSNYCDDCLTFLRSLGLYLTPSGSLSLPANFKPREKPPYPVNAVRLIEIAVRSASPGNREGFAWVLRRLQIIDSRLGGLNRTLLPASREVFVKNGWVTYICDFLEFRVKSSKLFPYARDEVETIDRNASSDELSSAAFFADFHDLDIPELADMLKQRSEHPS